MKDERNENQNAQNAQPDPGVQKLEGTLNIGNVKPFTKYRAAELILCGIAVILGLLYLYADALIPLGVLLPVYCADFFGITVLRYLDAKETGSRGLFTALVVACWAALGIAMVIATVVYFTR